MPNRIHVAFVAGLLATAAFGIAQSQTRIETVPIRRTSAASGQQMYADYCAVCHGIDGRGNGPAASALKVPPTDLTTLSRANGGTFPMDRIYGVLRFGVAAPAHGSPEMPVWGSALRSLDQGSTMASAIEMQRISNLTRYLRSLQQR